MEGRWWVVATFREGAIARIEVFDERAEALAAAGLSGLPALDEAQALEAAGLRV